MKPTFILLPTSTAKNLTGAVAPSSGSSRIVETKTQKVSEADHKALTVGFSYALGALVAVSVGLILFHRQKREHRYEEEEDFSPNLNKEEDSLAKDAILSTNDRMLDQDSSWKGSIYEEAVVADAVLRADGLNIEMIPTTAAFSPDDGFCFRNRDSSFQGVQNSSRGWQID